MITILTGSNNFGLRAELRRLVAAFVDEHGDMALERLDGEEAAYERIQEALQSLPFLAARKLVVLDRPGANKQFVEKSAGLLEDLPETTDLIIVEPKLDKRSSYYKFLKKQQGYQEYAELDENGLAKWLVSLAKEKQADISLAEAKHLIDRAGTNQQMLAGEIEKLSLYSPNITKTTINLLTPVSPRSTIFQMLEAAFAGNTKRTLELYAEQRALKVEPLAIIAMLGWQLHIIAVVKAAGASRPPDVVAREAKINPYVARKSAGIARSLSLSEVKRLVADLLTIDARLKRESLNADDVVQEYLLGLAG